MAPFSVDALTSLFAEAPPTGELLTRLVALFPELALYEKGAIAASPCCVEEASAGERNVELYRTVGALACLSACLSESYAAVASPSPPFLNVSETEFHSFCAQFKSVCGLGVEPSQAEALCVMLAVHDVGKSVDLASRVNALLSEAEQSADHDLVLANALQLVETPGSELPPLFPTFLALPASVRSELARAFAIEFHLPQFGQARVQQCEACWSYISRLLRGRALRTACSALSTLATRSR